MNLSSEPTYSGPPQTSGWEPADFGTQTRADRPNLSEQMRSIFTPPVDLVPQAPMRSAAKSFIRAADQAQARFMVWQPGEVEPVLRANSESMPAVTAFPSVPERRQSVSAPDPAPGLLAEARRKAEEILRQAQAAADEIPPRAQEQAAQATADGFAKGRDEARAEAALSRQAAQAMIAELAAWREGMISESEGTILEMIRQIARLMFGGGIRLDKDALQTYLNEVVENTRSLGDLNIYLNPDDFSQLEPAWADHQAQIRGSRVHIAGSPSVLPGGCVIKGQMGSVDASVETKLAAVLNTLSPQPDSGAQE